MQTWLNVWISIFELAYFSRIYIQQTQMISYQLRSMEERYIGIFFQNLHSRSSSYHQVYLVQWQKVKRKRLSPFVYLHVCWMSSSVAGAHCIHTWSWVTIQNWREQMKQRLNRGKKSWTKHKNIYTLFTFLYLNLGDN